jgi:periplasmic protein TonB
MAAYVQDTNYFSRRAIAFVAIAILHVFLAWAIATGLARQVVEYVAAPLQTEIIEELQERDEPPPPPPPEFERPPVEVPPPDIRIDIPVDTPTRAIQDVTDRPVPMQPPPPPPPPPVKRVAPTVDQRRSPATADYYPPTSRRLGEEGVTTVRACVTTDGRAGNVEVRKSSGSSRLDEAAIRWTQRARFAPGTEDGRPIESCTEFNVRFRLEG